MCLIIVELALVFHLFMRTNVKLGLFTFVSNCLDLDLNYQTMGASSDDGFIFEKIN